MSEFLRPELRELGRDGCHVWYTNLEQIPDERLNPCRSWLAPDEIAKLDRFAAERDRRLYLATHAMLRAALSSYADISPAGWSFSTRPDGKPAIAGPRPPPPLSFNLSHSQAMGVCAVARGREVGVDVEDTRRPVDVAVLAERFFTPREAADVLARSGPARCRRFFEYWTLKEAVLKASGEGLVAGLSGFTIEFQPDGAIATTSPAGKRLADRWLLHQTALNDHCLLAVALEGPAPLDAPPRLRAWMPR